MSYDGPIDVARLRKELEFITAHRERWNQLRWIQRPTDAATECGTTGCLAGNTVLNAGYEPVFGIALCRPGEAGHVRVEGRRDPRTVLAVASELLGLDSFQADRLFYPTNTLLDLWLLAARFTDGEVEVPEDVRREHLGVLGNYHDGLGRVTYR